MIIQNMNIRLTVDNRELYAPALNKKKHEIMQVNRTA